MQAYFIKYQIKGSEILYSKSINAKDVKSAKNKIENKENKRITIKDVSVIGYY